MDLADLRLFLAATRHPNLLAAADEVHLTPSALSRAIKRLEMALKTPLFDREGKSLKLNAAGERLRQRATDLLDLADQTRSEFEGGASRVHCRVAAPAILQWQHASKLAAALTRRQPDSTVLFRPQFEDDALAAVARGDVDFALVTGDALASGPNKHLAATVKAEPLGTVAMQLACGDAHRLAQGKSSRTIRVSTETVLAHDFATPTRSAFCGAGRGSRSDGWRDDRLPRRIRYWVDDLQTLLALVRAGLALAYLPELALREAGLRRLTVTDCPYQCEESAFMLWRPVKAMGWQARLVADLG